MFKNISTLSHDSVIGFLCGSRHPSIYHHIRDGNWSWLIHKVKTSSHTTTFVTCSAFRVISFLYFFFFYYYYCHLFFLKSLVYFSVFLPISYINLPIKHIFCPVILGALPVEIPLSFVKGSDLLWLLCCATCQDKVVLQSHHKISLHVCNNYW